MSSSITLKKILEALDVYSQHLFNIGTKIRRVEDSYENLIVDLQRKVDAGIISKEDSTEFEDIAVLWLNLYKSFICRWCYFCRSRCYQQSDRPLRSKTNFQRLLCRNRFDIMSKQQLKELLNNVLDKKNKTMNTIYNDFNLDVKRLKVMVEDLRITEESFKTDVTAIVTMTLEESKSNGRIASDLYLVWN